MSTLFTAILDQLDSDLNLDGRAPDLDGCYWSQCPLCLHEASTLSVSEGGFVCSNCGAVGDLFDLGDLLGIVERVSLSVCAENGGAPPHIYTLAAYAEELHVTVPFLQSVGLSEWRYRQTASVRIPYRTADGREVAVRYLTSVRNGHWGKGSKPTLYGLDRLDRSAPCVYVVEGEANCHLLWARRVAAVAIPPGQPWRSEWAESLAGLPVRIWQRPGGEALARSVAETLPEATIALAPDYGDDFLDLLAHGADITAELGFCEITTLQSMQALERLMRADHARWHAGDLVTRPDILGEFAALCRAQGLVGEERTARLLYLAVTSRLLDRPISVVVKGPSSGGKSFTVETVLKAFPSSAYYALTAMSDHALAYSEESLVHRMLVLYEAAALTNSEVATYMIRSLLSEGHIKYDTVDSTREGNRGRTIDRPGPTGLLMTTTAASLHPENETRLLSVTVRDTPEQTAGILRSLAKEAMGQTHESVDFTRWHALQEWLELGGERRVVIPFAGQIAERAQKRAVRQRRDFGAVLNLIRSHAILHQATRDRDADGRIVATPADYAAAYELVIDIVSEGAQASVKPEVREAVVAVQQLDKPNGPDVTYKRVAEALGIDVSAAQRRCQVALHHGYLINRQTMRYRPAILSLGDALPEDSTVLPRPDEIAPTDEARPPAAPDVYVGGTPPKSPQTAQTDKLPAQSYDDADAWQRSLLDEADSIWDPDNC